MFFGEWMKNLIASKKMSAYRECKLEREFCVTHQCYHTILNPAPPLEKKSTLQDTGTSKKENECHVS